MADATDKPTDMPAPAESSIGISLVVLGLKYLALALTGSAALYSDMIETIINVVTASAAFFTIRISLRPADPSHLYGQY